MIADIVLGIQMGDEGKGKVTHHLCKTGGYTHVLRFNGGCNAGHTIYHDGKKFVTHHIPSGIFHGVKSVIGPGCVVSVEQFFNEIKELEDGGISTKGLIFIAQNAHVITPQHLDEDSREQKIGTTRKGNGPAYRDKYNRTGVLAKDIPALQPYLIDLYEEFHEGGTPPIILCEGAQGFGLDIDHGDYPYVTSSHCTTAGALLNSIPHSWVRNVWGVGKVYDTYVGAKSFEPDDSIFQHIRDAGEEYGATTGRPRQCNWMDFDLMIKAIRINGVTNLVLNKVDVLREVGEWKLFKDEELLDFEDEFFMKDWIVENLDGRLEVFFSESKHVI